MLYNCRLKFQKNCREVHQEVYQFIVLGDEQEVSAIVGPGQDSLVPEARGEEEVHARPVRQHGEEARPPGREHGLRDVREVVDHRNLALRAFG